MWSTPRNLSLTIVPTTAWMSPLYTVMGTFNTCKLNRTLAFYQIYEQLTPTQVRTRLHSAPEAPRFHLKIPPQFDCFACPISNSFCEYSNLPNIHSSKLARLCNCCIVKSSDKLLNYLMFGRTLIKVKMETLKTNFTLGQIS